MNNVNNYYVKKSIWNTQMIVSVVAIVLMAMIILAGTLYMIFSTDSTPAFAEKNNMPGEEVLPSNKPILNILSCPTDVTTNNPSVYVEGIMVSDVSSCTLYINGEKIAMSGYPGNQAKWSKTYRLNNGETRQLNFEVEDANGNRTTETRSIHCKELKKVFKKIEKPIVPGCTLVKKKSGGLNIREYPGTYYDVVAYIGANDYTSKMVFVGKYSVNYDGYTWYEVIAPNGKHGYVRSDLVANYEYVS